MRQGFTIEHAQAQGALRETLARGHIGERIGARGDERLDELGEGIERGIGGDLAREIARQIRIDERERGQHPGAAQAGLEAVGGRSEDGVARDFGASAGGSRHGDEGKRAMLERPAGSGDFEVVKHIAGVGGERGDSLPCIDGAAAADGHDDVTCFAAGERGSFARGFTGRVASHAEDGGGVNQVGPTAGLRSGDQQRTAAKGFRGGGETGGGRAGAEDNAGGGGKFKPRHS